ncbi:MAG: hotdog domain-containing protein [Flavobacterium sp.]
MRFHTRKWVKPEDLNANHTLFGGRLLAWIDEEVVLYCIVQLENPKVVTKHISEINFVSSAKQGDIIEIGIEVVKFGHTSMIVRCEVRNIMTRETILKVDSITMVNLNAEGKPTAHGKTQVEYVRNRIKNED